MIEVIEDTKTSNMHCLCIHSLQSIRIQFTVLWLAVEGNLPVIFHWYFSIKGGHFVCLPAVSHNVRLLWGGNSHTVTRGQIIHHTGSQSSLKSKQCRDLNRQPHEHSDVTLPRLYTFISHLCNCFDIFAYCDIHPIAVLRGCILCGVVTFLFIAIITVSFQSTLVALML